MTLIGILEFDKGTKLEYSDPNWNNWGWKALIGISPIIISVDRIARFVTPLEHASKALEL